MLAKNQPPAPLVGLAQVCASPAKGGMGAYYSGAPGGCAFRHARASTFICQNKQAARIPDGLSKYGPEAVLICAQKPEICKCLRIPLDTLTAKGKNNSNVSKPAANSLNALQEECLWQHRYCKPWYSFAL